MSIEIQCFVCTPSTTFEEEVGSWATAHIACKEHCDLARWPSGLVVGDFITGSNGSEGSGVSFFLGPVAVGGHRAWLTSVAGLWLLSEERFVSQTYAEWCLLHVEERVEQLYKVWQHRRLLQEQNRLADFFKAGGDVSVADAYVGMIRMLRVGDQCRRATRYTPLCSPQDAFAHQSLLVAEVSFDDFGDPDMRQRILRLAERRFIAFEVPAI